MVQASMTAAALAEVLEGVLWQCPADRLLTEVLGLEEASGQALSFFANAKYRAKALASAAGLILAAPEADLGDRPQLLVANPALALAQAIELFHPEPAPPAGAEAIHPTAWVGPGVVLGPEVALGPGCTVGARTTLGRGVRLHAGVHVGEDCVLGEGCELFSGVVLYRRTRLGRNVRVHGNAVLGSDGFGYVSGREGHRKVPHVGWVEVEDEVEIGAGTTVDRGVLGATRVGRGSKIDNLCQIAHNVRIGEHCLIVSQVGISGSTTLGDFVTLAGKVGVAGHLHLGAGSIASANAMIAKDLPERSFVSGFLARPHREWLASQSALNRLPATLKALQGAKG